MATNRWKNLDYATPSSGKSAGQVGRPGDQATGGAETVADGRGAPDRANRLTLMDPWSGSLPGVVGQARGAYLLRNYQTAVDLLEPQLTVEPDLPGGQRLLGQALARLNREPEAVERLREAGRLSSLDWLARASLASLLLRGCSAGLPVGVGDGATGRRGFADRKVGAANEPRAHLCCLESSLTEAVTSLQAALDIAPLPAVRELLGAACWRCGQAALAGGRLPEAASRFGTAVSEFEAAARESRAAAAALTVRRSTSFVGQAAALLSAGRVEAAQQLFSRSSLSGVHSTEPLARFAASLYSFCDELAGLPSEEVVQAGAALREAVLAVRLEVGFYDGRQAVSLAWVSGSS